jgi:hypothetical protein
MESSFLALSSLVGIVLPPLSRGVQDLSFETLCCKVDLMLMCADHERALVGLSISIVTRHELVVLCSVPLNINICPHYVNVLYYIYVLFSLCPLPTTKKM